VLRARRWVDPCPSHRTGCYPGAERDEARRCRRCRRGCYPGEGLAWVLCSVPGRARGSVLDQQRGPGVGSTAHSGAQPVQVGQLRQAPRVRLAQEALLAAR